MRHILRDIYLRSVGSFCLPKHGIHILNGHYVTPDFPGENDHAVFKDFLKHLVKRCKLLSFQDATRRIINNDFPTEETYIAFSFDDGYEECYTTIAPLLEEYGCNAAFFINANYVNSKDEYRKGYNERVKLHTKRPMSWAQILNLHERGHVIGSHTLDHLDLSKLDRSEMDYQLIENKRILESRMHYVCDHFAWPYGQFQHFNKNVLEMVLKYHKYVFSGTNYQKYFSMERTVLNRRHIESFWPKSHINYFLSVSKNRE